MRIRQISADQISENPPDPRHPRAIGGQFCSAPRSSQLLYLTTSSITFATVGGWSSMLA